MTSRNDAIENVLDELETNLLILKSEMGLDKVPGWAALDTIKNYIFFLEKRVEKLGGSFKVDEHEDIEEFTRPISEEFKIKTTTLGKGENPVVKTSLLDRFVNFLKKKQTSDNFGPH